MTPKRFVAVCDFSYGGLSFSAGDVVPHGRVLARLLGFGSRFVTEDSTARKGSKKEGADHG